MCKSYQEKKMVLKFFPQMEGENNSSLYNAVDQYLQFLATGDYEPEFENGWDDEEQAAFIKSILKNNLKHFGHMAVPNSIEINLPCIAHLFASLRILEETANLSGSEKFNKLKEIGALAQVEAGMPGPCLIYLNAILKSSTYDNISKIGLLNDVINNLKDKTNKYGVLGTVVLSVAIKEWFLIENGLDKHQKDVLSEDAETFGSLQGKYSLEKKTELTFIDKCIMRVWEKAKIGIDSQSALNCEVSNQAKPY